MPSLVTERIESVKAGIVGAGAFAIAELVIILVKTFTITMVVEFSPAAVIVNWELAFQLAIGAISGFLFGVTYRYIIREDRNSHLNDGAVMAFGLVRGLALVEGNLVLSELLSLGVLIVQSIICFAIARFTIDFAISRKLIKPFI
ncbi:hypothetical protein [Pleurocapsa sp. PCC 7319]|uniref:hypothetical protein n=1 Tax=Pleurocapsa sp. PCC 7319 TaxID=118161 RepID=UPI000345C907|nr:hypothetical protein [Pleurocapsa sp. PCC 7319]